MKFSKDKSEHIHGLIYGLIAVMANEWDMHGSRYEGEDEKEIDQYICELEEWLKQSSN